MALVENFLKILLDKNIYIPILKSMKTTRKEVINLHIEPDQIKKLRELSKKTKIPYSEYIRKAISIWIATPQVKREFKSLENNTRL